MPKRPAQPVPTVVSLFTGGGGLDLGLEVAGFQTVAAVDNDGDCINTLRANQCKGIAIPGSRGRRFLHGTKLLHERVEAVHAGDLRPTDAPSEWTPDLLAGGPPCQPFSSAGKQKGLDDPRGRLFEEFVRLADELRPKFVLFENVRGLVTAPGPTDEPGEALALVRRAFERIGYATTFNVLNAADYGSSQRRVRMFMLATRGSPLPTFPAATHAETPQGDLLGRTERWVTLGEFLASHSVTSSDDFVRPTDRLRKLLAAVPAGSGLKSPGARESTRPGGHWGYKQGTFVADLDKPARTVTAASTQDWIRWRGELRRLTASECAGLQGFPSEWEFTGGKAAQFRQIGNAFPVIFGTILGRAVRAALLLWSDVRTTSAPWPRKFVEAVSYTKRERERNGESRRAVKAAVASNSASSAELKGTGGRRKGRRTIPSAA